MSTTERTTCKLGSHLMRQVNQEEGYCSPPVRLMLRRSVWCAERIREFPNISEILESVC
jgi:hypothetical protein